MPSETLPSPGGLCPLGCAGQYRDFGLVRERPFVALQLCSNQLLDHQLLCCCQLDALSFPGALATRFTSA